LPQRAAPELLVVARKPRVALVAAPGQVAVEEGAAPAQPVEAVEEAPAHPGEAVEEAAVEAAAQPAW
jgi:hypothetical protein